MSILKYSNHDVHEVVVSLESCAENMKLHFNTGVAIYGAGFLGTWAAKYLCSIGAKVNCFIDKDPAKVGTLIQGIPVCSPDEGAIEQQSAIFIASRHVVKLVSTLIDEKNSSAVTISFDGYFVIKNYVHLCEVRERFLHDSKSIETFNAILLAMLSGSVESCLKVMEKDMYFSLPEFSGTFEDTFVDAGAFVGDTVERFMWENLGTFKHVYAFEPGKRQFKAFEKRLIRLSEEWVFDPDSVSAVNAGLSSEDSTMACTFTTDAPLRHGLSSEDQTESNESVDVYTLDSYLEGKEVSFIKADVEGMEVDLLNGAAETIRRFKPKMALCVYHYPSDLYEIVELVHSIVPEYKYKLRQHAPLFGDFVLYCYME